jgi:hypothetical protein
LSTLSNLFLNFVYPPLLQRNLHFYG